jgi:type 1 fimbriae regulatory protein FimB/type 1 fimbriae regulatory protein FimE
MPHKPATKRKSNSSNLWTMPTRKPNAELRTREHLTEPEVERLMKAVKTNRYGPRDAAMILIAYRHGLRAAELVDLRWDQVEFGRKAVLHVRRVKNGIASTHPLQADEIRALRALMPEGKRTSPFAFVSERDAPFTTAGFARMLGRAGIAAKFAFVVHPHMLRHGCGYKLANDGHDTRSLQAYLGHRNIQHTTRYTELSPTRFKDFWR